MTLLDVFRSGKWGFVEAEEIARAIAIAQVVEKYADHQETRGSHIYAIQFIDEAEKLLRGVGKDPRNENSAYGAWLRGEP